MSRNKDLTNWVIKVILPYIPESRSAPILYELDGSVEEHKKLVDVLLNIRGKALLSCYAHPVYQPLEEAGWEKFVIPVRAYSTISPNRKEPKDKVIAKSLREEIIYRKG